MDGKVVQTELPEEEYELLRDAVRRRKLSIKEGVKEAIREWINAQIPVEEDPLFKVSPAKTGVKTDSSNLALYREADEARRIRAFGRLVEMLSEEDLRAVEESSGGFREGFGLR